MQHFDLCFPSGQGLSVQFAPKLIFIKLSQLTFNEQPKLKVWVTEQVDWEATLRLLYLRPPIVITHEGKFLVIANRSNIYCIKTQCQVHAGALNRKVPCFLVSNEYPESERTPAVWDAADWQILEALGAPWIRGELGTRDRRAALPKLRQSKCAALIEPVHKRRLATVLIPKIKRPDRVPRSADSGVQPVPDQASIPNGEQESSTQPTTKA